MAATPPIHETTVAMADSHAVLCESLAAFLANQDDMRVTGTCSTVTALMDLVDSTHPEVLIVDSDLYNDIGLDALRELTAQPNGPKVILLMTKDEKEPTADAMRLGASACVLKQAPLGELITAIRSVAIGQMWMSPPLLTAMLSEYRADADQLRAREMLNRLTPREVEVLKLMVCGYSRPDIATRLHVSNDTVRTHVQNLEKKLRVHSAVAAVAIALKAGVRPDQ